MCWSSLSSSRRLIKIVISLKRLVYNIFLHLFVLVRTRKRRGGDVHMQGFC